jgi:hypothetical protein
VTLASSEPFEVLTLGVKCRDILFPPRIPKSSTPDEAFKWLQFLYDERNYGLLQIRYDPDMDNLRSDPRYADLVRRIGFPQ